MLTADRFRVGLKLVGLAILTLAWFPQAAEFGKPTVEFEFSGEYRVRAEGRWDYDLNSDAPDERTPILQRVRFGRRDLGSGLI